MSECSWPMPFFDRFFPVLGSNFGLGALGIFQCLISTQILSHHVDDFTLVSAFFLFVLGCINMLLGLVFRETAKSYRSIRAWRAEARGILPSGTDKRPIFTKSTPAVSKIFSNHPRGQSISGPRVTVVRHDTSASEAPSWRSTEKVGYGFGRQGEKAAGLRGFILSKPEESLPRYMAHSPVPTSNAALSRHPSTSSSFYSKDVPREVPPPLPRRYHREDDEESDSRSGTPTFKSSKQVL